MRTERRYEMQGIETFGKYIVEFEKSRPVIPGQKRIRQRKGIVVIQYVEISDYLFVFHILSAESHGLVKYGQRIPHGPVRLHGYDMERLVIDGHSFFQGYGPEIPHDTLHRDPVEIVSLAA